MKITLDRRAYELLYDSLIGSPRGYVGAERRIGGAMLSTLEAWGDQTETPQGPTYRARYDECTVEFTEIEARLAIQMIDAIAWTGRAIRDVTKLLASLGSKDDATVQ